MEILVNEIYAPTIYIYYIVISCIVGLLLKLFIPFFHNKNWLDHFNERKNHEGSIPRAGGIAMFIGFTIGLILVYDNFYVGLMLLFSSFIALILGLMGDMNRFTPIARLFLQIILALLIISFVDIEISSFGSIFGFRDVSLGNLVIVVTVLSLLAGMNALNVIDGIDGLAGGVAMVAFFSISYLAFTENSIEAFKLSMLYIAVLMPFMYFNLSQNKVFMGDSGALFIGLGIAWILIKSSQGEMAFLKPVTALWIFAIPLIDIVSVILLRIKKGVSPFLPDNNHIHHQIIKHFHLSRSTVMKILLSVSALISIVGILADQKSVSEWIMFLGFIILFFSYFLYINYILSSREQ